MGNDWLPVAVLLADAGDAGVEMLDHHVSFIFCDSTNCVLADSGCCCGENFFRILHLAVPNN